MLYKFQSFFANARGNQLTYLGRSQFSVSSLETDVRLFACLFSLDSGHAGIFVSDS